MPSIKKEWEKFNISYRKHIKTPVNISMCENKITITAHVKFAPALLKPYESSEENVKDTYLAKKPEGYTFADAAIEGIKEYWGKKYTLPGFDEPVEVEVNLIRYDDPNAIYDKKQRFFKIRMTKISNTSFVTSKPWRWLWGMPFYLAPESAMLNWSPYEPGTINMQKYKYLANFKKTVAHEFGHVLGIGDAYDAHYRFFYEAPNTASYMMNNNVSVHPNELMMVLRAHETGRMQYFPFEIHPKAYFKELFRRIKRNLKSLIKSHKTNH